MGVVYYDLKLDRVRTTQPVKDAEQQKPKIPLSDEILNFGYIACPDETDIAELQKLSMNTAAFNLLHLKKVVDGKCTKRSDGMLRLVNVKRKSGGYFCFNVVLPYGDILESTSCAISSDVIRLDEAPRLRKGKFKVISKTPTQAEAECDEGSHVYAYEQQKLWYAVGVFSAASYGFDETTLPEPQLIKRAKRDDALRDACRGLLQ